MRIMVGSSQHSSNPKFLEITNLTPLEEVGEGVDNRVEEFLSQAVLILYTLDSMHVAVNEYSYFVIDADKKTYVQRETLVDLLEWREHYPVIGLLMDSLLRYGSEQALRALVDPTIPNKLFEKRREYSSIEELTSDIIKLAGGLEKCECIKEEPPSIIPAPTRLLKAVKLLGMKNAKTWMCTSGKISVKVGILQKTCFTLSG